MTLKIHSTLPDGTTVIAISPEAFSLLNSSGSRIVFVPEDAEIVTEHLASYDFGGDPDIWVDTASCQEDIDMFAEKKE